MPRLTPATKLERGLTDLWARGTPLNGSTLVEDLAVVCMAVPMSIFRVFAPIAASKGNGETVAARSDERGTRLRPFPTAPLPRQGQWTARARHPPIALVTVATMSSGRTKGTQFSTSSHGVALPSQTAMDIRCRPAKESASKITNTPIDFGAARRWYQTPNRIPAEEMAAKIEAMVKPIFFTASV